MLLENGEFVSVEPQALNSTVSSNLNQPGLSLYYGR